MLIAVSACERQGKRDLVEEHKAVDIRDRWRNKPFIV